MTVPRRDPQAGITLIETLVVLAVIGIGAGTTLMATGDRGRDVQDQAVYLARALSLGVDEALITGRPLALRWDARGYSFVQLPPMKAEEGDASTVESESGSASWPAADPPLLGQRHDLPEPIELRVPDVSDVAAVVLSPGAVAPTVTFDVSGPGTTWTVVFDGFNATASAGGPG